ncbi:MAG: sodium:solute symporter family protein [Candidatus Dependentiae bacterium]|nr:sodium:solute symporter family protein [Candidatus Dependentiae bacterium]
MNTTLFLAIFSILAVFYFFIGLYASRNIKNNTDYFLASRDLGLFPVTFTLIATQLGGGMLMGTAEQAYTVGIYGITYTLGMSLGFLLLGLGFAAKLRSLNVATTAELFETKYHSPMLKKVASLLSIATMCGILVGQVVASRTLLAGMQINNEIIFILVWAFIITYTMIGGLKAVVVTDTAQVWVIILVFFGIFGYCLSLEPSSFFSLAGLIELQKNFSTIRITSTSLLATIMLPALFSLIEQDLAQRFFAARTQRIAALSAFISSAFLLTFSLVPIYFGVKAFAMNLNVPAGASPLIPIIESLTNDYVALFAICGILAAITSTADSLLCAISSNLAQDFDFSFVGIHNKLKLSKMVTLITGAAAFITSYFISNNVIDILISSYEISVSCLLVPLLFSYFGTNLKKNAAIVSILFGLAGFIIFRIHPIVVPKEIAALILSLIGYWLGNSIKKELMTA